MTTRTKILFIVFCSLMTLCFAQTNDKPKKTRVPEATLDVGAFYTPLLTSNTFGLTADLKFYVLKKLSTGFCASITNKKINDTFQLPIGQPMLYYSEIGWVNQFDVVQKDRLRIGLNLNNGFAQAELGDNDTKVRYYSRYGSGERAKIVSTNYFYLLEPGVDINVRLFNNKHDPDLYLTAKAKYRFLFGDTKYGQTADFSNYYFGLGLSIIGFHDKKHSNSGQKGSR